MKIKGKTSAFENRVTGRAIDFGGFGLVVIEREQERSGATGDWEETWKVQIDRGLTTVDAWITIEGGYIQVIAGCGFASMSRGVFDAIRKAMGELKGGVENG